MICSTIKVAVNGHKVLKTGFTENIFFTHINLLWLLIIICYAKLVIVLISIKNWFKTGFAYFIPSCFWKGKEMGKEYSACRAYTEKYDPSRIVAKNTALSLFFFTSFSVGKRKIAGHFVTNGDS